MKPFRTFALGLVAVAAASLALPAAAQKRTAAAPATAASQVEPDRADLERSQIIGNRELPKVLYIVPWKKPGPGDLARPRLSVADEALAPLDRDVFRRQVRYDAQAVARSQEAAPAAAPAK
jgi:hypothetical protein